MKVHSTNYANTLILVSPDCRATEASIPERPGTIAAMQYEMIAAAPYALTSDDVIFSVYAERKAIPASERETARTQFFSRGQACMRTSPLVRSYGWGVHHDGAGRMALVAVESPEYAALAASPEITKVNGMRSRRA